MKVKNVLLTGGNGQLGLALLKNGASYKNLRIIPADIEDLDITREGETREFFLKVMPDLVINCAAYTAVDGAENDREMAYEVNKNGPANLSSACRQHNIPLIHVSTDYVFSGKAVKPYKESDVTDPVTVYGKSKLEGENEILNSGVSGIIIRTSWLYSEFGENFVKTMIRLGKTRESIGVVSDQFGSPTYAGDLAAAILHIADKHYPYLLKKSPAEIFHYCNSGVCSWNDLAVRIMDEYGLECEVKPVSTIEFPRPAPRPEYSVLETKKIRDKFKLEIPVWKESLIRCIGNIKTNG